MRNAPSVSIVFLTLALLSPRGGALGAAESGVAFRVADLRTQPPPAPSPIDRDGVDATGPLAIGPAVLFGGRDLVSGFELWRSDGSPGGTAHVFDLATAGRGSDPVPHLLVDGVAFLTVCTPTEGCELWRSDGTAAGSRLLFDVRPGVASSDIVPIAGVQGLFFFAADDGAHGCELWRSDGTAEGTRLVRDVRPGPEGSLGSYGCWLAHGMGLAGRLLFAADDGVHGRELWRSDGSPSGTYLLKSLAPGEEGGEPDVFLRSGSRVYFRGADPAHGDELWSSDGSAQGTRLVRDFVSGSGGSGAWPIGALGGGVLVGVETGSGSELWHSDGTSAGTRRLRVFEGGYSYGFSQAVPVGASSLFCALESATGMEPWVSDGTVAGTIRVADLDPGPGGGFGSCHVGLGHDGAYVFHENQLWRTTSAAGPLEHVAVIEEQGVFVGLPSGMVAAQAGSFFQVCYDDDFRTAFCRLWRTDGTQAGTTRVFAEPLALAASSPHGLIARTDDLVFAAEPDGSYGEVMRSDGTAAGTYAFERLPSFEFWAFDDRARLADGDIVFPGTLGAQTELWRTGGDGLERVTEIGGVASWPSSLARAGDLVYFGAESFAAGEGLYATDGTHAGTIRLRDDLHVYEIAEAFGKAWITGPALVDGEAIGEELWESSGTAATTIPYDLVPGFDGSRPEGIVELDAATGSIAFLGWDAAGSGEVFYRFDPTTGEAAVVRVRSEELESSRPGLGALNGRMLFLDLSSEDLCALWSSDGTAAGTVRTKHVGAGMERDWPASGHCPSELVAHRGALYFTACGPLAGCELWRSDGTTAGTNRLVDLVPGPGSSFPAHLTSIGDRLYLEACTPQRGCEPWVTDGSAAGLHRLADIAPGAASSSPAEFTLSERLVYFAADDGTGAELWAMPLELFYDGFEGGNRIRWSVTSP